jgi:hypothetical protein
MMLETVLSIAMLAGFIWAIRFLLPKALKEHDTMALTCAVLTAVLTLLMWLLIGVGTRSGNS